MGKNRKDDGPLLVAVDFSDHAMAALIWALRTARLQDVPMEVLHVVHDPGSAPGYYAHTKRKQVHRLEDAAKEMMSDFLKAAAKRHPKVKKEIGEIEGMLIVGLPVTRILEVADEIGAQQIVMGSTGRTGLPHFLLGSKAERVVQLSPIPVTIVKSASTSSKKGDS